MKKDNEKNEEIVTVKITDLVIKSNTREDMGDLQGLANSIKENGQQEPIKINSKNEVIFGHRRIEAMKLNGSETIKALIDDSKDVEILKLIENDQRKDLNPIEQGNAYHNYMNEQKISEEELANRLGKNVKFVNSRLNLVCLTEESKEFLLKGKIQIGHANLISKMTEKEQKKAIEEIIQNKWTVSDFADSIRWYKEINPETLLEELPDDFKVTKGQKNLFESVGQEIKSRDLTNTTAFKKKLSEYVNAERKRLTDKGIIVFKTEETLKETYPEAFEIRSYDDKYKQALKDIATEKYAVVVDLSSYGSLEKSLFCLKKEKPKETKTKKSEKAQEEEENILAKDNKEKLKYKIESYMTNWMQKKAHEKMIAGEIDARPLTLFNLIKNTSTQDIESPMGITKDYVDKKLKIEGSYDVTMEKIYTLTDKELSECIYRLSAALASQQSEEDLIEIAKKVKLSSKDFVLEEEFLKLYTKDQLINLGKELGVKDLEESESKGSMMTRILASYKGIPKLVTKTLDF